MSQKIEYKGYIVEQVSLNNHVWVTSPEGKTMLHAQMTEPMTEEGLKAMVDNMLELEKELFKIT